MQRVERLQQQAIQDPRTMEASQRLTAGRAQANVFEGGFINDSVYMMGLGASDPRMKMIQKYEAGNDIFGRAAGLAAFIPEMAKTTLSYATGGLIGGTMLDSFFGLPMDMMGMGRFGDFQQGRSFSKSAAASVMRHGRNSSSLSGRGVSNSDGEVIADLMKDFASVDGKGIEEIQTEMSEFINRGMFKSSTTSTEFVKQYKEIKDGLKETIETLGKTYEDALDFMQGMTSGAGFTGKQVSAFAGNLSRTSRMTGMSTDHLLNMSMQNIDQFRGTGISGSSAGNMNLGNIGNVITGTQLGYIDAQTMWQLGGEQGAMNSVMNTQISFLNQGLGNSLSRAAFKDGRFDLNEFRRLSAMDPAKVKDIAAQNMTIENQLAYKANQQSIQNQILTDPSALNSVILNQITNAANTGGFNFNGPGGEAQFMGYMMSLTGSQDPSSIKAFLGSTLATGYQDKRAMALDAYTYNEERRRGQIGRGMSTLGNSINSATGMLEFGISENSYSFNHAIDDVFTGWSDRYQREFNGITSRDVSSLGSDIDLASMDLGGPSGKGTVIESRGWLGGKGNGAIMNRMVAEGTLDLGAFDRVLLNDRWGRKKDSAGNTMDKQWALNNGYDMLQGHGITDNDAAYKGLSHGIDLNARSLNLARSAFASEYSSIDDLIIDNQTITKGDLYNKLSNSRSRIAKGFKRNANFGVTEAVSSLGMSMDQFRTLGRDTQYGIMNTIGELVQNDTEIAGTWKIADLGYSGYELLGTIDEIKSQNVLARDEFKSEMQANLYGVDWDKTETTQSGAFTGGYGNFAGVADWLGLGDGPKLSSEKVDYLASDAVLSKAEALRIANESGDPRAIEDATYQLEAVIVAGGVGKGDGVKALQGYIAGTSGAGKRIDQTAADDRIESIGISLSSDYGMALTGSELVSTLLTPSGGYSAKELASVSGSTMLDFASVGSNNAIVANEKILNQVTTATLRANAGNQEVLERYTTGGDGSTVQENLKKAIQSGDKKAIALYRDMAFKAKGRNEAGALMNTPGGTVQLSPQDKNMADFISQSLVALNRIIDKLPK